MGDDGLFSLIGVGAAEEGTYKYYILSIFRFRKRWLLSQRIGVEELVELINK